MATNHEAKQAVILLSEAPQITAVSTPLSPLNAVWSGSPQPGLSLPQWGHILLVFPLHARSISCAGITLAADRYLFLAPTPEPQPVRLEPLKAGTPSPSLLVLWLSPAFIVDMAHFLQIPDNLQQLLHGVPLWQGDQMSALLTELAAVCPSPGTPDRVEALFLECVGDILRQMRLRHQALLALAPHKQETVADLLPRLLQARQLVAARHAQKLNLKEVAAYVALSEFHFARLFKAAFDVTPHQYLIGVRLDEARRLLEQPGATVTDTALQVGYKSLSSFIHAFTKKFGLSPGQYQAQTKSARFDKSPGP